VLRFDLQTQELWLEGTDPGRNRTLANLVAGSIPQPRPLDAPASPAIPLDRWHWHTSPHHYAQGVERIRQWIAAGDLFQANLTACCDTELDHPPDGLALFRRLRHHCPAPFAGLVIAAGDAAGEAVISASPERFLQVSATGQVETRPIKGTRPRFSNPASDADAAVELVCSAKDRAENVMIVDLLRNDLGRVCVPGSIQVPQLVGLESYPQVHHLTSVVTGQLQDDQSWASLLRACWPGGSITGAPKVRACQRLNGLEPVARGPYCGSLLRVDWDGSFDSSILIRSVMLRGRQLRAHAGCGIVADSDPTTEADELGWKLQPLLQALS
jgi:para-aminobenzoate synthetase component 1